MKFCSGCKRDLPIEQFNKNKSRKDGLQTQCKECNRRLSKADYAKSPEKYRAKRDRNRSQYREANIATLTAFYLANPCVDCGESDIRVLTCDHVVRETKVTDIGSALSQWSSDRFKEELAKCQSRCANCHMRRSANQLNWWRASVEQDTQPW